MNRPRLIHDRLHELARHESRQRLFWGFACTTLAVVVAVLVCLEIDWLYDLWFETPQLLRWSLRLVLVGLTGWLGYHWMVRPQQTGLQPEDLAVWVEKQSPQFGHRLISALQLNDDRYPHDGMSPALIDAVTSEAETQAKEQSFTSLLSNQRYQRGMVLLVLAFLASLLYLALHPTDILLQRLFGADEPIPRNIQLHSTAAGLYPQGEPVTLEFTATGSLPTSIEGVVEIIPEGQAAEKYPLVPISVDSMANRYAATIPPSSKPFTYRAWLYDGRLKEPGSVTLVPRPIIQSWEAALLLPGYVGLRPDQKPYELPQPKGDLKPVPRSSVRLQVTTPTPITSASVELLGPIVPDLATRLSIPLGPIQMSYLLDSQRLQGWTPLSAGPLYVLERQPLLVQAEGLGASAVIPLPPGASAYRIIVTDQHGLTNRPIPRRAITFHADELPQVTLLPERFSESVDPADEIDLEGMPVPLGKSIRIGYLVKDDLVIDRAVLRYRINDGQWESLSLSEVKSKDRLDARTGAFEKSNTKDQVAFFAVLPTDAQTQLGRSAGGGRFDFQTRSLPRLRLGDVIDYCIEVYDRHEDDQRPPGRSVVRRKTVVNEAQFVDWLVNTVQQENRLKQVERQQRRVFEPK
jgi:hypothetical protein